MSNFNFPEYVLSGGIDKGPRGQRARLETGDIVVDIVDDCVDEFLRKVHEASSGKEISKT
jgi:hypothetical protein